MSHNLLVQIAYYVRNLYQSKPDRLNNVIQMKGHLTKY